jgi:hypothetical protein
MIDALGLVVMVGGWIWIFGVFSRLFERQADTFAAKHLARRYPDEELGAGVISARGANLVADSLMRVASLNHIKPGKRSWRHGSIKCRVNYLRSLVGKDIEGCAIDNRLRRVRYCCLAILLVCGYLSFNTEAIEYVVLF